MAAVVSSYDRGKRLWLRVLSEVVGQPALQRSKTYAGGIQHDDVVKALI